PRTGVVRTYRARAFGNVTQAQLEDLSEGITIDGVHYGSIDANLERRTGRNCWLEMRLTEGKNREVRRVLEHLGLQVSRLIRTSYGPFTLGGLEPGQVDEIGQVELDEFRRTLKLGSSPATGAAARSRLRPDAPLGQPRIACAKPCFRCSPAGSARSRTCVSPICSPGAARWDSRPFRAAQLRPHLSSAIPPHSRRSSAMRKSSMRSSGLASSTARHLHCRNQKRST